MPQKAGLCADGSVDLRDAGQVHANVDAEWTAAVVKHRA
jgi:hypothetical protein